MKRIGALGYLKNGKRFNVQYSFIFSDKLEKVTSYKINSMLERENGTWLIPCQAL